MPPRRPGQMQRLDFLMSSLVTGRSLSPSKKRIAGLLPVLCVEVSADAEATATTMRDQDDPSPHKEASMPNYNQPHQFYAGVDLHARSMFVHVLSHEGKTVFERDLPAEPDAFLDAVKPFRKNLVV